MGRSSGNRYNANHRDGGNQKKVPRRLMKKPQKKRRRRRKNQDCRWDDTDGQQEEE